MASVSQGQDLELIQTETLGFKSIVGDAKLRLTAPWPSAPSQTASLLSIASSRGIVAAAGPDGISIASTSAVRKGFEGEKEGDSDVRPFQAQKLPLPMRVSHISFTADETYLILSAETGGGLAVYETQSLLQGASQTPAFELGTNGEMLRALVPNPTAEKAELCAIVTNNGNLHMANLKERQISKALKSQVSCVSWSTRGKQLVAGLADGSIHQMTPEGEGKAEIPRPPSVSNGHVAALSWLENHVFLAIHINTNDSPPSSTYHIITRQPPSSFTYQKMTDPVDPFGAEQPPHHSILRLKDFPPGLQDLLIVASTASPDIGLLSRSKTPLTPDKPADSISNVFTTTELLDDSKRAQLPMSDSFDNTIPIGVALDLSSKDKVYKPLPADEEIEDSPGPLPGYWVLNNEGVLCSWWVVYEDSIRQGTTYPGLAASTSSSQPAVPAATIAATPAPMTAPSTNSAFGSSSPAFGGATTLGAKASPWGSSPASTATPAAAKATPAFGSTSFGNSASSSSPAFGKPSAMGFGQSTQLGMRTSPWGSGNTGSPGSTSNAPAPAFGQSGFGSLGNSNNKSAFSSGSNDSTPAAPTASGFASFAGSSGFAKANTNSSGGSIFSSKPTTGSPFGSGSQDTSTAFPPPKSTFGQGQALNTAGPFKLESSFKADPAAKEDNQKPAPGGSSLFGSNFGAALGDTAKPTPSKDQDMEAESTPQPLAQAKPTFGLGNTQSNAGTPSPFSLAGGSQATQTKSIFGAQSSTTKSPFSLAGGQTQTKSIFSSSNTPPANENKSTFGSGGAQPTSQVKNPFSSATTPPQNKSPFRDTTSSTTPRAQNPFSQGASQDVQAPRSPLGFGAVQSTTPTTTPAPSRFGFAAVSDTPKSNIFGPAGATNGKPSLFSTSTTPKSSFHDKIPDIKVKVEEKDLEETPLPPESTSRNTYPLGESSSSSGTWTDTASKASKTDDAPLPPDFMKTPKATTAKVVETAPLPPDPTPTPKANQSLFSTTVKPSQPFTFPAVTKDSYSDSSDEGSEAGEEVPLPPDFTKKPAPKEGPKIPAVPDSGDDSDLDEGIDAQSEGSGVIVGKDTSPSTTGITATPGYTPQSSFGGMTGSSIFGTQAQPDRPRNSFFGEMGGRPAPMLPRPNATSPRSPSPVRSAVPGRMSQHATRSVSAPGMASQILASKKQGSQMGLSVVSNKQEEDPQLRQQRLARSRREAEETKPLEDEEDDEIQKILSSEVEPTLALDDFIAHTNVIASTQETIPSQVEAVYRDINSMIDMLGLNARSLAGFVRGHSQNYKQGGRCKEDLEDPDDWVLCEVNELGEVLDKELAQELEEGRVQNVEEKLETCQDLAREMSRLRSKQEDLKKLITVRLDPDRSEVSRSLPLSAEQAAQQNELRREYGKFMKQLTEAEESLTLLKTKLATLAAVSGRSSANVPTVDAVMRTIHKMTSMAEKRSGDIDVLENQMRKLRFSSVNSREGSPAVTTPQRNSNRRSVLFSPESMAGGSPRASVNHHEKRNSFMSSVNSLGGGRNTTPRKKLSGFSSDEKTELMDKRAKRRGMLEKLKANVEKNGVQPWPMPEDVE